MGNKGQVQLIWLIAGLILVAITFVVLTSTGNAVINKFLEIIQSPSFLIKAAGKVFCANRPIDIDLPGIDVC